MDSKILDLAVKFSALPDPKKLGLDTILFHFLEDETRVVSTDGHCLAVFNIPGPHGQTQESILVSAVGIDQLKSTSLSLMIFDGTLFVTDGDKTITTKIIGDMKDYPDYRTITSKAPSVCAGTLINPQYLELVGMACKKLKVKAAYMGTHGGTTPMSIIDKQFEFYIMPMEP